MTLPNILLVDPQSEMGTINDEILENIDRSQVKSSTTMFHALKSVTQLNDQYAIEISNDPMNFQEETSSIPANKQQVLANLEQQLLLQWEQTEQQLMQKIKEEGEKMKHLIKSVFNALQQRAKGGDGLSMNLKQASLGKIHRNLLLRIRKNLLALRHSTNICAL